MGLVIFWILIGGERSADSLPPPAPADDDDFSAAVPIDVDLPAAAARGPEQPAEQRGTIVED